MGQPVSKNTTTAPFENYQVYTGPTQQQNPPVVYAPDYPTNGQPTDFQGPPPPANYGLPRPRPGGRPMPRRGPPGAPPGHPYEGYGPQNQPMGDDFWADEQGEDPIYLPEQARRIRPGGFDPFADEQPRRYPPGGVTRQRGLAGDMIDGMRNQRVQQGRAQQYRAMPPQGGYAPQQSSNPPQGPYQPRITKYTSYVNEPAGFVPPNQGGQSYQQQQAPQIIQQAAPQQPANGQTIIYYDPATGAVTGQAGGSQTIAPQCGVPNTGCGVPQVVSYPQAGQQMVGYPQTQAVGQQQPFVLPQMGGQQPFMFPQMGGPQGFSFPGMQMMTQAPAQQQQPIVIPGSLYTGTGGVQRLG